MKCLRTSKGGSHKDSVPGLSDGGAMFKEHKGKGQGLGLSSGIGA